jgi:hypothetical protein
MKLLTNYLLLLILVVGCTTIPTDPSKVEPTPVYSDYWPKEEFRKASIKAIQDHGGALLTFSPKDKAEWCWKDGESAVSFYNRLFSSITKYESNYRPAHTWLETFREDSGKGPRVLSTGLMQNSRESCTKVYKFPSTHESLKDPYNNLVCSVKIFARWVPSHGVIAQDPSKGAAIYYSTMRGWIVVKGKTVPGKRRDILKMLCGK